MQSPGTHMVQSSQPSSTNNIVSMKQPESKATSLPETMPQVQELALPIVNSPEPVNGAHCTASICFSDDNKLSVDNDLCSILSAASPLFASQLKERNVIIPLPQFNIKIFRLYQAWLYNRNVDAHLMEVNAEGQVDWQWLCHSYALGQHVQDGTYCDRLTDMLKSNMMNNSSCESFIRCIGAIFPAAPETSPLRNILVDIALWYYPGEFSRGKVAVLATDGPVKSSNQQFFLALKVAQGKVRFSEISPLKYGPDPCRYHCHPPEASCRPKSQSPITSDIFDLADDWAQCFSILFDAACTTVRALSRAISSTSFVSWKYLKPAGKSTWSQFTVALSQCKKLFKRRSSCT